MAHHAPIGRRIVVIGTSGSGKTTMGHNLGRILGIRHVELDSLHWEANWTEAATEVFRERVARALHDDSWVVDGNYSKGRDLIWPLADTVVWLDYPLPVVMARLVRRTVVRYARRIELWQGNRERLWPQFFTRDSLWLFALQTHSKHRQTYPSALAQPEYRHLTLIHLRSPREAERWLAQQASAAL